MAPTSDYFNFHDSKFTCGDFLIDPSVSSMSRNGREKRMEPKHLSLLCYMASRENQVISRKELAENVWASSIVVEEVITHAVFALRNALGDDAKNPKYIETIPRKGYRLIAQVSRHIDASRKLNESATSGISERGLTLDDTTAGSSAANKDAGHETSFKNAVAHKNNHQERFTFGPKVWPVFGLIGLLILSVCIITVVNIETYTRDNPIYIENIRPITHLPGEEKEVAIHSGSQKMAYVYSNMHASPYSEDIFITDLSTQDRTTQRRKRLTNSAWLPRSLQWLDEDSLAYIRCRRQRSTGCQIVTHTLGEDASIVFSPEKATIFDLEIGTKKHPTLFVSKSSYDETILNTLDLSTGKYSDLRYRYNELPLKIRLPQYSNDTKYLFMLQFVRDKPSIAYLDLNTKKLTTLPHEFDRIWDYALDDNNQIFVTGNYRGTYGLWQVNLGKASPQLVHRTEADNYFTEVILDPSANTLYLKRYSNNIDINIASIDSGSVDALVTLNSSFTDTMPVFSDDGQSIYFFSNRSGVYEIWRYSLNDKHLEQISNMEIISPKLIRVSDDERFIAVTYRTPSYVLAIIERSTGNIVSKTAIPTAYQPLSWSRDGNSIYVGDRENDRHLLRFNKNTLTPEFVLSGINRHARESLDGKSLRFLAARRRINELVFENNKVVELFTLPKSDASAQYYYGRMHGDILYLPYIDRTDDINFIKKFDIGDSGPNNTNGETIIRLHPRQRIRDINQNASRVLTTYGIPEGEIFRVNIRSL